MKAHPRFTTWKEIGQITVKPDDDTIVVGSFAMDADDDTIWVRISSLSPPTPWPWSYGVLSWKTTNGNELGTIKAYSDQAGTVFRLGVGLQPLVRTGSITFQPRSFNLAWVKKGNPWSLKFEAQSGSIATGAPVLGTKATLTTLADLASKGVSFVIKNGYALINLT